MTFQVLYSANGKQIFPRRGMKICAGTIAQIDGKFVTLNCDHVIDWISSEYDSLSQSRIQGQFVLKKMN